MGGLSKLNLSTLKKGTTDACANSKSFAFRLPMDSTPVSRRVHAQPKNYKKKPSFFKDGLSIYL